MLAVRFGIALGRMHPSMFLDAVTAADELGFESVWFPEHLVLPVDMTGSPFAGAEHPPVPPSTPVFDVFAYLSFLAGRTRRVRLGTHVYNLGLRHPFAAARAVQTADVVSQGRVELGVGAGWLRGEWDVAGLDFDTRGPRLDEALEVCRAAVDRRAGCPSRAVLRLRHRDVRAQTPPAAPSAGAHRRGVTRGAASSSPPRRLDRPEPHP